MRQRRVASGGMFINFALSFAKAVLALSVILFVMISPKTKEDEGIKPKVEYIITVEWPGEINADVDTWIRNPSGAVVYYGNKEGGFIQLERDVLGTTNGAQLIDGGYVKPINQEMVTIRGIEVGEYTLNLHLYSYAGVTGRGLVEPIMVTVSVDRINPKLQNIFRGVVKMEQVREEVHVVHFTLEEDGHATDVTTKRPVELRQYVPPASSEIRP